jgi:hypothetical protein
MGRISRMVLCLGNGEKRQGRAQALAIGRRLPAKQAAALAPPPDRRAVPLWGEAAETGSVP